jgi:hypothetical protein
VAHPCPAANPADDYRKGARKFPLDIPRSIVLALRSGWASDILPTMHFLGVVGSAILAFTAAISGCSASHQVSAGPLGGVWHVHTNYLTIAASSVGTFQWPIHLYCGTGPGYGPPPCDALSPNGEIHDGGHARLLLTGRDGNMAHGTVTGSSDPSALPDGSITLRLSQDDTLHITTGQQPVSPSFEILCGVRAASLTVVRQDAEGINCGA